MDLFESFKQSWNTKTLSGLKPDYDVFSIFLSDQKTTRMQRCRELT